MEVEERAECQSARQTECRAHPRIAVDEMASLLLVGHELTVQCCVLDLSLEGCRLLTSVQLPAGIRASVEVTFKINGVAFRVRGVTQWNDGRHAVGIHFEDVSSRRKEVLGEVLREVEAENATKAEKLAAEEAAAEKQAADERTMEEAVKRIEERKQ